MPTFIQKRENLFSTANQTNQPIQKRSESRLKNYSSCNDLRAWQLSDESRRQCLRDIIKVSYAKPDFYIGKFVPFKILMDLTQKMLEKTTVKNSICSCFNSEKRSSETVVDIVNYDEKMPKKILDQSGDYLKQRKIQKRNTDRDYNQLLTESNVSKCFEDYLTEKAGWFMDKAKQYIQNKREDIRLSNVQDQCLQTKSKNTPTPNYSKHEKYFKCQLHLSTSCNSHCEQLIKREEEWLISNNIDATIEQINSDIVELQSRIKDSRDKEKKIIEATESYLRNKKHKCKLKHYCGNKLTTTSPCNMTTTGVSPSIHLKNKMIECCKSAENVCTSRSLTQASTGVSPCNMIQMRDQITEDRRITSEKSICTSLRKLITTGVSPSMHLCSKMIDNHVVTSEKNVTTRSSRFTNTDISPSKLQVKYNQTDNLLKTSEKIMNTSLTTLSPTIQLDNNILSSCSHKSSSNCICSDNEYSTTLQEKRVQLIKVNISHTGENTFKDSPLCLCDTNQSSTEPFFTTKETFPISKTVRKVEKSSSIKIEKKHGKNSLQKKYFGDSTSLPVLSSDKTNQFPDFLLNVNYNGQKVSSKSNNHKHASTANIKQSQNKVHTKREKFKNMPINNNDLGKSCICTNDVLENDDECVCDNSMNKELFKRTFLLKQHLNKINERQKYLATLEKNSKKHKTIKALTSHSLSNDCYSCSMNTGCDKIKFSKNSKKYKSNHCDFSNICKNDPHENCLSSYDQLTKSINKCTCSLLGIPISVCSATTHDYIINRAKINDSYFTDQLLTRDEIHSNNVLNSSMKDFVAKSETSHATPTNWFNESNSNITISNSVVTRVK